VTEAEDAVTPLVSFQTPTVLTPMRVVCRSPVRSSPVVTDMEIALNGQDYHTNGLEYAYFVQPTRLTHLTPVTAGPSLGGSVITIHGEGLAAFARWGAQVSGADERG
jgi:hypothetical protein